MMTSPKVVKKKKESKIEIYRTKSYWELFDAIGAGNDEKVTEILENSNDPRTLLMKRDLQGLTPLKKAMALSKADIARILVSFGAEPSVRDPLGRTALHVAAMQGKRELIAPLLVSSDSCVNVQDNEGWTPLHLAVRGQHEKAINWLLYAGADIHLKNKNDLTPIDLCEADSPIRQMLERKGYNLDDCPIELCSAFIGSKRLNMIGSGGKLMFVTSGLWSDDMQFFFNVRLRPYHANPPIPLRQDEMFFDDVFCYRMMYRLPQGLSRVHAYFLSFEHFRSNEVILKITSKSKFLGEVPVALSTYTQDNFTCFLASTELDLKDAGQFVLVSRSTPVILIKGEDGMYSNSRYPIFKFDLPMGALPGPPPNWEATRERRARNETDDMLRSLLSVADDHESLGTEDQNRNADQSESENIAAEGEAGEYEGAGEDDEDEAAIALRRPQILDGNEPDESEDFYYISKGWGLYLECRQILPLQHLVEKPSHEKNIIIGATSFYTVSHTSGLQPKLKCRVQIPKSGTFVKMGTVLVYLRDMLKPGETEFPDPDDQADEHFLSSDGKNVWGTYWLNKEKERWSLLPSGISNKKTRVVFETDKLTTFIVVQLRIGTQKWEAESDEERISDEEGDKEKSPTAAEPAEKEEGDEASRKPSISSAPTQTKASGESETKKIKGSDNDMIVDYGDDDISDVEVEPPSAEEDSVVVTHSKKASLTSASIEDRERSSKDQRPSTIQEQPEQSESKNDDNASNVYGRDANANQNRNQEHTGNSNINMSNATRSKAERNKNNNEQTDDDEISENLAPEERTIVKNLEPAESNYALVLGVPFKPAPVSQPQTDQTAEDKPAEEEVEEQEGPDVEDAESDEDIPYIQEKVLSLSKIVDGKVVPQTFRFGQPLTDININETDEALIKTSIALMWRYRNHRESTAAVFTRLRDGGFDMIVEIVRHSDLYVRAEHWWSQDYKMISESAIFPLKSGRLFSFGMEGTMIVESPPGSSPGYILTRSAYCYLSQINSLQYYVRRGISAKEDEKGPKKGPKKKEDLRAEPLEPDAILEITGYPRGTRTNGVDIAVMPITLTGQDLWYDRHVELRKSDNILLARLVKYLRKESDLVKRWWKVVIMLGYSEKMVEAEKGKNKSSIILATVLKKWFEDNLNSRDRGILMLITVLNILGLDYTINGVVFILKGYKALLLNVKQKPRYLKLLFHWVIQTKMTRNSLVRMIGPQIMKPVSDIFLLRLSELLNPEKLYKIGACMDVEDNVIHAIAAEEVITDEEYLPFRVFIKSRQKKDEIIHYTLLLLHMVKQCEEPAAKTFVVNETKKWMETVADTEPEVCAKLHNVFD